MSDRFWLVSGDVFHVPSLSYPVTARTGQFTVIRANRRAAMDRPTDLISDNIEVVPVVVLSQTFPARPSSIPDVRDFVKRCLAQSPLSEQDNREVGETVAHALLEAAGPAGAINVSFRIFPDHVDSPVVGRDRRRRPTGAEARRPGADRPVSTDTGHCCRAGCIRIQRERHRSGRRCPPVSVAVSLTVICTPTVPEDSRLAYVVSVGDALPTVSGSLLQLLVVGLLSASPENTACQ